MLKVTVLCFCVFVLGALFVPRPEYAELDFIAGRVLDNDAKKSAGRLFRVQDSAGVIRVLNIPNSSKETNLKIENINIGDRVEVWYTGTYTLVNNSYDAWKLVHNKNELIAFKDTVATSWLYIRFFVVLALIALLFFLIELKKYLSKTNS